MIAFVAAWSLLLRSTCLAANDPLKRLPKTLTQVQQRGYVPSALPDARCFGEGAPESTSVPDPGAAVGAATAAAAQVPSRLWRLRLANLTAALCTLDWGCIAAPQAHPILMQAGRKTEIPVASHLGPLGSSSLGHRLC